MTNFEKIKGMSAEALDAFFEKHGEAGCMMCVFAKNEECHAHYCDTGLILWLQQEAEVDE